MGSNAISATLAAQFRSDGATRRSFQEKASKNLVRYQVARPNGIPTTNYMYRTFVDGDIQEKSHPFRAKAHLNAAGKLSRVNASL